MANWVEFVAPWTTAADLTEGIVTSGDKVKVAKEHRKLGQAELARARLEVERERELERERAAVGSEVDRIISQLNREADAAAAHAAQARAEADARTAQAEEWTARARAAEEHSAAWESLLSTMPPPPYSDVEALRAYRMLLLQSGREMASKRSGGLSGLGSGLGAISDKAGTMALAGAAVGALGLMEGGRRGRQIALAGAALFGLGWLWKRA